ncbi:MAG: glycosyltransferase family 39 protein [Rudaea sp.]
MPHSITRVSARQWFLLVAILAYALLFQGARAIYSPDEGRYTDVALGMLDDGDWLRPMLHPEFEHWTKPPLTYWAIATSIAIFGQNEFAARLPNALAFAGTIFLLLRLGRRVTPVQPWRPALVYATFLFPFAASNIVTTDTLLTLFETMQLVGFADLWWSTTPKEKRRAIWLLWFGAGLAFVTKGPPGLLLLAGCLAFAVIDAGWRGIARVLRWDGLLIFLVVGCGWYLVAILREPGVLRYFLVEEVVNRIASNKMHRNGAWYDGFRIYLPVLLLGTLPWLPLAIVRMWRTHRPLRAYWTSSLWTRWLLCCIGLPLLVFMLSRSRLPLYILPLFVPIACLVALRLGRLNMEKGWRSATVWSWCVLLVCARGAAALLHPHDDDKRLSEALSRALPQVPAEIAFVETAPRYGMRFYLGSTIERLTLPGRRILPASEGLAEEMNEDEGCRVLMVDAANLAATLESLDALKIPYRRARDVEGYALLVNITPLCKSYAALTGADDRL